MEPVFDISDDKAEAWPPELRRADFVAMASCCLVCWCIVLEYVSGCSSLRDNHLRTSHRMRRMCLSLRIRNSRIFGCGWPWIRKSLLGRSDASLGRPL